MASRICVEGSTSMEYLLEPHIILSSLLIWNVVISRLFIKKSFFFHFPLHLYPFSLFPNFDYSKEFYKASINIINRFTGIERLIWMRIWLKGLSLWLICSWRVHSMEPVQTKPNTINEDWRLPNQPRHFMAEYAKEGFHHRMCSNDK